MLVQTKIKVIPITEVLDWKDWLEQPLKARQISFEDSLHFRLVAVEDRVRFGLHVFNWVSCEAKMSCRQKDWTRVPGAPSFFSRDLPEWFPRLVTPLLIDIEGLRFCFFRVETDLFQNDARRRW